MLEVLIVDDDLSQLRIREAILRNAGLVVHVANNVESALAVLRAAGDRVGLVITDHFLPERTGADLVREMRLSMPSKPVLVLSGMPGVEDKYTGLNVSVLLKPIDPDELVRIALKSVSA